MGNIISKRLKELRLEHDLSQDNLAKLCNVKQSCVSKWERGITYPSLDIIIILVKIYKVSSDYILGIEN